MKLFSKEDISNYKDYYEKMYFPHIGKFQLMSESAYYMTNDEGDKIDEPFPWWWKHKILNWTYRFWDSLDNWLFSGFLFNRYNWMRNCTPGFIEPMSRLWNNVQLFCTP